MFGCGSLVKRASKAATRSLSLVSNGRSAGLSTGSGGGLLSRWHQLAERELSLLEEEVHRFLPALPTLSPSTLSWMARDGEHEFFDSMTGTTGQKESQSSEKRRVQPPAPDESGSSYSSYSFSYSAILDKDGERVLASSKRRRYEDSTGRLKACHERMVDGGAKKLTSTWTRPSAEEKSPQCKTTLEGCGSEEEFEKQWAQTAFADGLGEKKTERRDGLEYGSQPPESKQQDVGRGGGSRPFGPDVDAAMAAPEKERSEFGDGVTREAREKSREDAIAEGSRMQEEETTPPM